MNKIHKVIMATLLLMLSIQGFAQQDEFYHDLYNSMHDSPMQQKFRKIAPVPYGVVFLPWAGMTEAEMRKHFRMMKELGFTNLKQTMGTEEWPRDEVLRIALEEGIIPFWYGQGGWEDITPELLRKIGLREDMTIQEARKHPKMIEYQNTILAKHLSTWRDPIPGEEDFQRYAHKPDMYLRQSDLPFFKKWVRKKYKTVDELSSAWNLAEVGIPGEPYQSWSEFEQDPIVNYFPDKEYVIIPKHGREYGKVRDILRFKADMYLENVKFYKQKHLSGATTTRRRRDGIISAICFPGN
jgi:beta-galactosidase